MKYVMTKDLVCFKFEDNADYTQYSNIKGNILKVADTIEELCDCFVAIRFKHFVWDKEEIQNLTLKKVINSEYSCPTNEFEFYGAIWTSKGLIYVAKMNDKGDLELI